MNYGLRNQDDNTDPEMKRSLASSIAKHEAAVEALKWHLEMDDYNLGQREYYVEHDYWTDDDGFRADAEFSAAETARQPNLPSTSTFGARVHHMEREPRFRNENPPSSVGEFGRSRDFYWSDDDARFRSGVRFPSAEAVRLPTLSELEDNDRRGGDRAYLQGGKLRTQPLSPHIPHRTVQLPSPPPTPQLTSTECIGNGCCWDDNCLRQRFEFGPDFEADGPALENGRQSNDEDELVAVRYQYDRLVPRPVGAETSLDGPANWPYACRPFFFRRADTPSARYY